MEQAEGEGFEAEVVGEEHQAVTRTRIAMADAAQRDRRGVVRIDARQADRLITTQSGGWVHGAGSVAGELSFLVRPNYEERIGLFDFEQAGEMQEAAIENIDRSGLERNFVQHLGIVDKPVGDAEKGGQTAAEIEQGVKHEGAQGQSARHKSMVVESSAYTVFSNPTPNESPA